MDLKIGSEMLCSLRSKEIHERIKLWRKYFVEKEVNAMQVDKVHKGMNQREDKFIKLKSPHVDKMSLIFVYLFIYLISRNLKS